MTDSGRAVLPTMDIDKFKIDEEIEKAMKEAKVWDIFRQFPPLYQRIRAYNISFTKNKHAESYQ